MQVPRRPRAEMRAQQASLDLHVTAQRLASIKKTLVRIQTHDQPLAVSEVRRLAELGDFSENAEYQAAKAQLRRLNEKILLLREQINHAVVIVRGKKADSTISIGSRISLTIDGVEQTFDLLGSSETNPGRGCISHLSPLGAALLGHSVGDCFNIQIGSRTKEIVIVRID